MRTSIPLRYILVAGFALSIKKFLAFRVQAPDGKVFLLACLIVFAQRKAPSPRLLRPQKWYS